ncbi:HD domain-containing protein [Mycobacteroides abscessus]|uniref:HD domain-containing protein n=1 Tax=Mycobacteroides abscessus TaxID=36809 RepID=UPI0002682490|nr:HD domain-containing protein [Mycobacteroides abscessus]EIU51645.1 putative metal dependent phosphohydrolase [Mycobacteroides abscessus 6G-0125-S]EIU64236.1 putative metal dependent phosphohydrolase [Mycobacteroides abscessus 6G-0728-S]EIU74736.1 putative metal dependent phosphohydrolase [Mycobacteroides abscessus 6G-1108]EIV03101.1 putative metal dependent phosphohydrolase [Mycobacteroides abscessus 6G-0728-R]
MSECVIEAREFARRAHAGQRDKAGREYFEGHLEPIATAAQVFGPDVVAAAWLHDVLEDTAATAEDLAHAGIPADVVAGVESVTRRSGETYSELIQRACADSVGRFVKLVDNAWNITANPNLAEVDPARAASLLKRRYEPARRQLLEACGLDLAAPAVLEIQRVLDTYMA